MGRRRLDSLGEEPLSMIRWCYNAAAPGYKCVRRRTRCSVATAISKPDHAACCRCDQASLGAFHVDAPTFDTSHATAGYCMHG